MRWAVEASSIALERNRRSSGPDWIPLHPILGLPDDPHGSACPAITSRTSWCDLRRGQIGPDRSRAFALGWPRSQVQVIVDDLDKSGQSIEGRPGFQRLLAEVALDRIGLSLGLEMSRLARSFRDWHHVLELCARFRVVLADADGVYDPTDYSDRLLMGLTGMMNENRLHDNRDLTRGEAACRVRSGAAPQVLAGLWNAAIHLLMKINRTNKAAATRHPNAKPRKAIKLILSELENETALLCRSSRGEIPS